MDDVLSILQIIVSSGLIVAIYNNYSQVKLQNRLKLNEITENKFRSILIFMDIMLHPSQIIHTSEINNPLIQSIDLSDESKLIELYRNLIEVNKTNLYLYADDKLIDSINQFLAIPNEETYKAVAKRMNKNLWK